MANFWWGRHVYCLSADCCQTCQHGSRCPLSTVLRVLSCGLAWAYHTCRFCCLRIYLSCRCGRLCTVLPTSWLMALGSSHLDKSVMPVWRVVGLQPQSLCEPSDLVFITWQCITVGVTGDSPDMISRCCMGHATWQVCGCAFKVTGSHCSE